MRKIISKIIRILDGTPQVYGKKERGQSVVELALVTPLLIILLVGLAEIGWFARNYLTLLEVSRVGARRGAVLSNDASPLVWLEEASLYGVAYPVDPSDPDYGDQVANADSINNVRDPDFSTYSLGNREVPGSRDWYGAFRENVRRCPPPTTASPMQVGFYNLVWCQMFNSMQPLELDETNEIDDVIISVFAIQIMDHQRDGSGDIDLYAAREPLMDRLSGGTRQEFPEEGHIPVVVGRYPSNANECNVWINPTEPTRTYATERDPFDYVNQHPAQQGDTPPTGFVDVYTVTYDPDGPTGPLTSVTRPVPLELAVEDGPVFSTPDNGFDDYNLFETQRGFVVTGQHKVEQTLTFDAGGVDKPFEQQCWGSERTVYWVQEQLYGGDYVMSQSEIDQLRIEFGDPSFCRDEDPPGSGNFVYCDQREFLSNQGLVLVEIYWQHQLLLDIPVFSPIYNALNDQQTTIYVWSAFPAPAVTPEIRYGLTGADFEE